MLISEHIAIGDIYKCCKNNTQTLKNMSALVLFVRFNIRGLPNKTGIKLLELVNQVLTDEVMVAENTTKWAKNYGDYFAGNMVPCRDEQLNTVFVNKYDSIFCSKKFTLIDIQNLMSDIINNYELLKSDFYLRIPEVVLRDGVKLRPRSNFKESGTEYANAIDYAFNHND